MTEAVVLARADVRKLMPAVKSHEEAWWQTHGALYVANEFGCAVAVTLYEPASWSIPGGSYKPDFLHMLADGRMVFVEVKALILKDKVITRRDGTAEVKQVHNSAAQHGYRDARLRLRAAAEVYPYFVWCEARIGKRGAFEFEIINP